MVSRNHHKRATQGHVNEESSHCQVADSPGVVIVQPLNLFSLRSQMAQQLSRKVSQGGFKELAVPVCSQEE